METTFLSIGLIHRTEQNKAQYLVLQTDDCWSLITGERLEKESFRETIIREVSWTLDLDRQKDFVVSNMSASSQEYVEEGSEGARHFAIAFYRARLYSKAAREKIESDERVQWVSARELCEGSIGGQKIIETRIVNWINRWSVLNPWE